MREWRLAVGAQPRRLADDPKGALRVVADLALTAKSRAQRGSRPRGTGYLDHTEVKLAMSEDVITVSPGTTIHEAARLLREPKIGAMPVAEDGKLVGMVSTTDILEALMLEE